MPGADQKQWDSPGPLPVTGGGDLSPVALRIHWGRSTCWGSQLALQLLYLEVVATPFCKQGKPAWWLAVTWLKHHTTLKPQSRLECVSALRDPVPHSFHLRDELYIQNQLGIRPAFLHLGTTDVLGWVILCCEPCALWDVWQHSWSVPQLWKLKISLDIAQCPLGLKQSLWDPQN